MNLPKRKKLKMSQCAKVVILTKLNLCVLVVAINGTVPESARCVRNYLSMNFCNPTLSINEKMHSTLTLPEISLHIILNFRWPLGTITPKFVPANHYHPLCAN